MPSVAYKDEFGTVILSFADNTWSEAIKNFVGVLKAKGFEVGNFSYIDGEVSIEQDIV